MKYSVIRNKYLNNFGSWLRGFGLILISLEIVLEGKFLVGGFLVTLNTDHVQVVIPDYENHGVGCVNNDCGQRSCRGTKKHMKRKFEWRSR